VPSKKSVLVVPVHVTVFALAGSAPINDNENVARATRNAKESRE